MKIYQVKFILSVTKMQHVLQCNKNRAHIFNCRVCGFDQDFEPWGEDGKTLSFDISDCCGAEFGYDDCSLEGVKATREEWLKNGAKWFRPKWRPENWSLEEQRKSIPEEFK